MAILTKSRLNSLTEVKLGFRMFSEVLNKAKAEGKYYFSSNTFLSHSHEDYKNGYLDKTLVLLKSYGINVYIDTRDNTLPPLTNNDTANRIKDQIKHNDKFIFLASEKAIDSKWCNWELGFGDSLKLPNNIALFPLAEDNKSWTGSEYLNVYPRIEESNSIEGFFKVIYPDRTERSIQNWLSL